MAVLYLNRRRGRGASPGAEFLLGAQAAQALLNAADDLVRKQLGRVRLESLGVDIDRDAAFHMHRLINRTTRCSACGRTFWQSRASRHAANWGRCGSGFRSPCFGPATFILGLG